MRFVNLGKITLPNNIVQGAENISEILGSAFESGGEKKEAGL